MEDPASSFRLPATRSPCSWLLALGGDGGRREDPTRPQVGEVVH